MSDMQTFLLFLAVSGVLALSLGGFLARRNRNWTRRKVAMVSAAAVPCLVGFLCGLVVGHAFYDAMINPERCGVDACGMEMAFGTIALGGLLAVYVLTLVPAWFGAKLAR
jgi:hypothetical protein